MLFIPCGLLPVLFLVPSLESVTYHPIFRQEIWSPSGLDKLSKVLLLGSDKQNANLHFPETRIMPFFSVSALWMGLVFSHNQDVSRGRLDPKASPPGNLGSALHQAWLSWAQPLPSLHSPRVAAALWTYLWNPGLKSVRKAWLFQKYDITETLKASLQSVFMAMEINGHM